VGWIVFLLIFVELYDGGVRVFDICFCVKDCGVHVVFGVDGYTCCVVRSVVGDRVAFWFCVFIKVVVCERYDVRCSFKKC
jgi:hypothetical protein